MAVHEPFAPATASLVASIPAPNLRQSRPANHATLTRPHAPDAHLGWAIEDLSAELSALLGKPVDLVSRDALNSRIRDEVLAEAQPFYPAA